MRLAIIISLALLGLDETAALGSDAPVPCEVGPHGGYLIPVDYADSHRPDILGTLPDSPEVYSFWNVTEQIAIVADRHLRETLQDAVKDPATLFPNLTPGTDATLPDSLEYQRNELKLIVEHYGAYHRQFVGLSIEGRKIVLLNYAMGPGLDPSREFIAIHRVFEPGRMRFLQARFDWDGGTISNVSLYGSWQEPARND